MRDCNPEEVKRRREESMVELRSAKRADRFMQKHRRRPPDTQSSEQTYERLILEVTKDCPYLALTPTMSAIQCFECLLNTFRDTTDPGTEEDLLSKISTLTCEHDLVPLYYLVHVRLIPKLLRLLSSPNISIARHSAWILVSLTYSSEANILNAIVSEGGISLLIGLINTSPEEIADHCIWSLSNMAGERDIPKLRDLILEAGILDALQPLTDGLRTRSPQLVNNFCWLLSNLTIGHNPLSLLCAEKMCWLLQRCMGLEEITSLINCLQSVFNMTKMSGELVGVAAGAGLLHSAYGLVTHENELLRLEALKCVGNFVTFSSEAGLDLLRKGLLDTLTPLLSDTKDIQSETLWLISSLLADANPSEAVISHPIFPSILHSLVNPVNKIRQEAIVCVHNLTCARTPTVIHAFISHNGIELIGENIAISDSKILNLVLGILINVLEIGSEDMKRTAKERLSQFESSLDRLLDHRNIKIKERVKSIYGMLDGLEAEGKEGLQTPSIFTFS